MKALIRHHLARALAGAKYNAIINCHLPGLHSVMLHDEPGNRIRMFYADVGHTLWQNETQDLSLAVHPHHCDVSLIHLSGVRAVNRKFAMVPAGTGEYYEFEYQSPILDKASPESAFKPTGQRTELHLIDVEQMYAGVPVCMRAHELHTVYVKKGFESFWIVVEGQEDPHYRALCYASSPPVIHADCYQQMTQDQLVGVFNRALEFPT